MWYRVFGSNEAQIPPETLLEHLQVPGYFRGDDQGWFQVELAVQGDTIQVNRYLATEEGIRAELNNWAAWLEGNAAEPEPLMQHLISTTQVFVWKKQDDHQAQALCTALCQFLARETAGIYQIDGQGFFDRQGRLLAAETVPQGEQEQP